MTEFFDNLAETYDSRVLDRETKIALYRKIRTGLKQDGIYIECDYVFHEKMHDDALALGNFHFAEYVRLKAEQGLTDDRSYHYDTPYTLIGVIGANLKKISSHSRRRNN